MATLKGPGLGGASLLSLAALVLYGMTAMAQNPTDACRLPAVIPLAAGVTEPPAKILIDPPQPGPLASRGSRDYPIMCSERALGAGVWARCFGCLPARRARPCSARRCRMGVGGRERQPSYPDGPSLRSALGVD
jgi:hypothetical protein